MRGHAAVLALVLIGAEACADQPASTVEARPAPVALTGNLRTQVAGSFDVNAVERYLGTMDQADSRRVLEGMGFFAGTPPRETQDVAIPLSTTDPVRQRLLAEIWRSYTGPFSLALLPRVAPARPERKGEP